MIRLKDQLLNRLLLELEYSNQKFQAQLKSNYPRLTVNDIRLCTYLNINLTTKEIALLLNITPDSVKKARHRLRKKLGVRSTESISTKLMLYSA